MGIMDMFKSAVNGNSPQPQTPGVPPQGTTPQQTQPMPGNIPTTAATTGASSAVTAGNGVIPQSTTDIAAASPLDTFKDLWKNDPNGTNKDEPYFNVNIDALNQAASQQDFTSSITQEQLQSIAKGGEDAIKAFAVDTTVNVVSPAACPPAPITRLGNNMVLVKNPCSICTAVSVANIEVIPNNGALPFGINRVIIPANDFFARSCVRYALLKIPALMF